MPIPLLIGAVAVSAVGTVMGMHASSQAASANADIASAQQQSNQISLQAMETDARRRQLETIRQAQIARSTSTASAVSQNAQLGSGLQGGYAQISGESNWNLLGINQNLDFGKEQAAVNDRISNDRISLAEAQGMSGFGSGLLGFGSIMGGLGSSGLVRNFSQNHFGNAFG